MTATRARRLVAGTAGLLLISLSCVVSTSAEAAARCRSGVAGDVNGDGFGELAVSSNGSAAARGGVHLFYGQNGRLAVDASGTALDDQYVDQDTAGVPGVSGARHHFGYATAFGDFNHDGCADLAIGAPEDGASGSVTVLFGSPKGLVTGGAQRLVPEPYVGTTRGARFGRSLVAADLDGDRIDDLAVGLPQLDVAGREDAGGVAVFPGSSRGLRTAAGQAVVYTQDSAGVPEDAGREHRFGAALVAGDFDGNGTTELAVGVTGETSFEGGVQLIARNAPNGQQPVLITAGSLGVRAGNEPISSFGTTLAVGDVDADGRDDLAVGAPDTVPPAPADGVSSGAVFLIRGSATGLGPQNLRVWTQENVGVPDPEVDPHRFGAALAFGRFDAGPTDDLAIGEPEDEVPPRYLSSGSVTVLFGGRSGLTAAGSRYLHQGVKGLAGTVEDGDRFGLAVAAVVLRRDGQQALVVGSPGEDIGGRRDAGRLHQLALSAKGPTAAGSRYWYLGSPGVKGAERTGGGFGLVTDAALAPLAPFDDAS